MKNWLIDLAPSHVAESEVWEPVRVYATPSLDGLIEKLAAAEMLGRDLAHKNQSLMTKEALAIPGAALSAVRGAAGMMMKDPSKALRVGGAIGGGLMGAMKNPGVDPATGQQKSRLGNMALGAAGGYGLGSMAGKSQAVRTFTQGQGKNLSQMARGAGQAPGAGGFGGRLFPKIAEVLETNDKPAEHAPLTGPGPQAAKVAPKGEKRASAALGALKMVAGNPIARRAAVGAGIGGLSGGQGHHLEGALTGGAVAAALGGGGARAALKTAPAAAKAAPGAIAKAVPAAGHPPLKLKPLVAQGPHAADVAAAEARGAKAFGQQAPAAPHPEISDREHANIMREWGVDTATNSPATAVGRKPLTGGATNAGAGPAIRFPQGTVRGVGAGGTAATKVNPIGPTATGLSPLRSLQKQAGFRILRIAA